MLYITVVGSAGSGKTQLCLSSAVCAAWSGRNVLYIDCSNGLTLQRMEQLISLRAHRCVLIIFISPIFFISATGLLCFLTHLLHSTCFKLSHLIFSIFSFLIILITTSVCHFTTTIYYDFPLSQLSVSSLYLPFHHFSLLPLSSLYLPSPILSLPSHSPLYLYLYSLIVSISITNNNISNNNNNNNNNSSSSGDASDNGIRALQQARTDTLNRITVRTAYDPWELLDVLTLALEPDKTNQISNPFEDTKLPPYLKKPGVPKYDFVIVDGLHFLFLPYYGIHPFDSRSASVIGGASGVGTGVGTGTGTGVRSVGVLGK